MSEIGALAATALAPRLQARELRAADLVEACLERIAELEPAIHAWTALDPDFARRQARELDAGALRGPLHGLPLGIKDILDTADFPTGYGSPIYRGLRPAVDAAAVAAARAAGAILLGKTATTEFACQTPPATVNPHNPAHTPGGSSSGSAAAVATGMVPFAFGTQTAGSIIRPASYCGIVGYKPSFGMIGRAGLKLVAESFDTIGALARSVADAALLVGAIAARPELLAPPAVDGPLRIGFCRSHDWPAVEPAAASLLEAAVAALAAAGARVEPVALSDRFAGLGEAHALIQGFEAVRNLAREYDEHRDEISPPLLALLDAGSAVSAETYAASQRSVAECRAGLPELMGDCRVLVTASATGEAPAGLAATGDPVMNRVWTALHAPCITVPAGRGPQGLPVGLQIVGRPGDDAGTLAAAGWIQERLPI